MKNTTQKDLLSDIVLSTKKLIGSSVQVGWDGVIGGYMSFVEYGTKNMPPRPALRSTADKKYVMDSALKGVSDNLIAGKSVTEITAQLGMTIKGEISHTINRMDNPVLAKSTIKIKGFDKLLIGGKNGVRSGKASQSIKIFINDKEVSFAGEKDG